ncbi:GNAT family N-acetyltransferase [Clostridium sp. ATCC 25772]|uniref:GNAT family N-acetyltransferase n=1 Tax=Clostridium sp. ATCC 25772 TaxID=1676991 RepID=UPI00078463ED|nr:GNAT family N-acetyltransferase [Clostridium sp. ATCC 25772]
MDGLKIVEYTPAYAKAIAKMWTMSTEGWNGSYANVTEESILESHKANSNLNTFLAVNNEEVLGYCALLSQKEALRIKLLNTRYDCHGNGIGKEIIKAVVNRALELDYPMIDLHTWSSNKKSIPFYKRCGFFLEKNKCSHCISFIPYILKIEALKGYFENEDWYSGLKQNMDMEPSGIEENGYEFYEYNWEINNKKLRLQFESRSRGLRLIETDDYLVSVIINDETFMFGKKYKVFYEIINKTGKAIKIKIKGEDDKTIKFQLNKEVDVHEKEIVEGEFYIKSSDKEIDDEKIYPAVVSQIFINNKIALFKVGILTRLPAKINILSESSERVSGQYSKFYINIKNNLCEEATFEFKLNKNDNIEFKNRDFKVKLNDNEKNSVEVPYYLKKPTVYSEWINVTAILKSGEKIEFKANVIEFFKGRGGKFGGETNTDYIIVNGAYSVILAKDDNCICFRKFKNQFRETVLFTPEFEMSNHNELLSKKIENICWYEENEHMILKGDYFFNNYSEMKVTLIVKLHITGIAQSYFEVYNLSDNKTDEEILIKQQIYHGELSRGVIPYNNKFIKLSDMALEDTTPFKSELLSENWIFSRDDNNTRSLWWDKDKLLHFGEWPYMYLEENVGIVNGKSKKTTKSIYVALTTFETWQDLRSFALKTFQKGLICNAEGDNLKDNKTLKLCTTNDCEVSINKGNPFIKDGASIELRKYNEIPIKGKIKVDSKKGLVCCIEKNFENMTLAMEVFTSMADEYDSDIISVKADLGSLLFEKNSALFKIKDVDFKTQIKKYEGFNIYSINNGVMTIKSSPDFTSGIYSLTYKNEEYLHSKFPNSEMRTWYNPWFGGMQTVPRNWYVQSTSLLNEKVITNFVKMTDTCGNQWHGIKTSLNITENEQYKGLKINEYYLMLPGVPVLCHTSEIINSTGEFMKNMLLGHRNFFNIGNDMMKNFITFKDSSNEIITYRAGVEFCDIFPSSSLLYGNYDIEDKIQIYANKEDTMERSTISVDDNVYLVTKKLDIANHDNIFMNPMFYIFTNKSIDDEMLNNLKNIQFK